MDYKTALRTVRRHAVEMLQRPESNIRLLAVGSKEAGALVKVKEFCVTAYVDEKLTKKQLKARGVEPFDAAYNQAVAGPPPGKTDLDVVVCESAFRPQVGLSVPRPQRGRFGGNPPVLNAQKPFLSLRCGISITNPVGEYPNLLSVGTAGFYMADADGNEYVVSNNHVIGGSNDANLGDAVVQPGTLDLTDLELNLLNTLAKLRNAARIAELSAVVQLEFVSGTSVPINRVDAAVARLSDSNRQRTDLNRLTFGGSIARVATPYAVDADGSVQGSARVYKVGRTTGYTEGEVIGLAGTGAIPYAGGRAFFADQIVVRATSDNVGPFSDRGDSGSGVLNDGHEIVGLLFAGSPAQTLVNPIANVSTELRDASGIDSLEVITG